MLERHTYRPTGAEIAWAAGLYEGEGTIVRIAKVGKNGGPSQWMSVRMTDREPIQEMVRIFGGSFSDKVRVPSEAAKGYKTKYGWRVGAWRDIIRVAEAIYPWLSPRRKAQIDAVMAFRPEHPRGELACPPEPIPSVLGMQRHRKLGIPPCDVCRQSWNLWYAERRKRLGPEEVARRNREQYLKNREARILQAREYRARKRQEGESSEIVGFRTGPAPF